MKTIGILVASALACASASPALAQTRDTGSQTSLKAPREAVELSVDLGYTQGFGALGGGRDVSSLAGAGAAAGGSFGYRISPEVGVAITGQYQQFNTSESRPAGARASGATGGIEATIHGNPYDRVDPWLSLGTGYRALFNSPRAEAETTITHGFELAKLQVGVDLRPSDNVAISPVIGADLNLFMWQNPAGGARSEIADRRVNAFVFAGVKGRFDLGGARETRVERIGQR